VRLGRGRVLLYEFGLSSLFCAWCDGSRGCMHGWGFGGRCMRLYTAFWALFCVGWLCRAGMNKVYHFGVCCRS
jgi:hypothetical protein